MTKKIFAAILLSAVTIAYLVQFITATGAPDGMLSNYIDAIIIGLVVYVSEFLIFRSFLKSAASLV